MVGERRLPHVGAESVSRAAIEVRAGTRFQAQTPGFPKLSVGVIVIKPLNYDIRMSRFRALAGCVAATFFLFVSGSVPKTVLGEDTPSSLESAIDQRREAAWELAQHLWEWAEPGYQEVKSSAALAQWLAEGGFRVERGVCGMPTAFLAEYGTGHPVIAILGEFDALPGLSQQAIPEREPVPGHELGHACGHNLFGAGSALAALCLKERMQSQHLPGTLRFYGCPAEEGGSAKAFMVRDGLFQDVDAVLHWHPSSVNSAGESSSMARIAVRFRFHGTSSHAAGAPEQGRSALDAVELTNFGTQLLREHVPEETRLHYVITHGGQAPNVVPNFAEVYYYLRHPDSQIVREIYQRVLKCAEAGALATETRLEVAYEGGISELLPNTALTEVVAARLKQFTHPQPTSADIEFASRLQSTLRNPPSLEMMQRVVDQGGELSKGSTDVGDVSWVVPTAGFNVACWVPGTPGHSWQAVACSNSGWGRQGMFLAAQVLAAAGEDLFRQPEVIASAQAELKRRLGTRAYVPLIMPDQKPPLDYRRSTPAPARAPGS